MGKATRWLKGLLGMKKEKESSVSSGSLGSDKKVEKKRWSFAKSGKDPDVDQSPVSIATGVPATDNAWLRSYITDTEKEQNKHAIAVAAAADAAVAAAQAAVAVVRLTSHGRGTLFSGGRESWAAERIQTVFRGFLARKALRALKGLVKIQALVRGFLVRKRAAATLHSMQALIRAQAAVRSQRARRSISKENRFQPEIRGRRSLERFDETRSEFHSKRLSSCHEPCFNGFESESPKIVEIDTYRTKSRSRRIAPAFSECEELPYQTISSPLPCPVPGRISVPDCRQFQDFEWYFNDDECKFATAQNTPRFARSNAPATPTKSVCGDTFFRSSYSNFPNYMANTQSFKAKLRSLSAPKQRPESKKKLSLDEIMAARNSISSVRMQRSSFSQVQESLNF
ncbi:hypothetical protein L6164_004334 [Bauhinia variegata]|uniref:Uncharacterized protein n=1 Tax=Bauhinia variegata TaxID=167791 RepID=A0ACB9Q4R6_BAUVA|nr:hypothetical protein L6164_004334 [Bauhinia variegata]